MKEGEGGEGGGRGRKERGGAERNKPITFPDPSFSFPSVSFLKISDLANVSL